jgi:hypothetical protein
MSLESSDLTLKKVFTSTMLESGGAKSLSAYSATLTLPSRLPVSTSYHGPWLWTQHERANMVRKAFGREKHMKTGRVCSAHQEDGVSRGDGDDVGAGDGERAEGLEPGLDPLDGVEASHAVVGERVPLRLLLPRLEHDRSVATLWYTQSI